MRINNRYRIFEIMVLGIFLSIVTGCATHHPLILVDDNYQIQNAKIAVISGDKTEATEQFAKLLAQKLEERSSLSVVGQKEVAAQLTQYPVFISFINKKDEKPEWYAPKEQAQIDSIQRKLNVQYLFVVWISDVQRVILYGQGGGSTIYNLTAYGNMIEYPKGKAISYSVMDKDESPSFWKFTLFKNPSYFVDKMLNSAADDITKAIVARTAAKKPKKG